MAEPELYDADSIRSLFDEMAQTYNRVNLISSFGFCRIWRDQCIRQLPTDNSETVCDLMTGMGECWPSIIRRYGSGIKIVALDFSPIMCRQANKYIELNGKLDIDLLVEDVLQNSIRDGSVDRLYCSFGLKTFSASQLQRLASEIQRILASGGEYSILEISEPDNALLRAPYMFYLRRVIPQIGRIFMGNPDNYRMLGVYTGIFMNCRQMQSILAAAGLSADYRSYFFGCATGVVGRKPMPS